MFLKFSGGESTYSVGVHFEKHPLGFYSKRCSGPACLSCFNGTTVNQRIFVPLLDLSDPFWLEEERRSLSTLNPLIESGMPKVKILNFSSKDHFKMMFNVRRYKIEDTPSVFYIGRQRKSLSVLDDFILSTNPVTQDELSTYNETLELIQDHNFSISNFNKTMFMNEDDEVSLGDSFAFARE